MHFKKLYSLLHHETFIKTLKIIGVTLINFRTFAF